MAQHDALEHDHANPPRARRTNDASDTESVRPPIGNGALAGLLGGGVDRAATKQQGAGPLDEGIAADIQAARGGGQAMDDNTRVDMESNLGVDLSGVRVHTDGQADHLSRSVQAEAFTTGSDVFFRSGKYQPESTDGRRLLAHELTHVVQQSTGNGGAGGRVSSPDDPHEREAAAVGDAVAASPGVDRTGSGPVVTTGQAPVARAAKPEEEEEVARAASPEEEEPEADRQAAPAEEEEEVARAAAPPEQEEEDVDRHVAPDGDVSRQAAPEEEEDEGTA